jgi:hypothetical protein
VAEAVERCRHRCEVCGRRGKPRVHHDWIRCLCAACWVSWRG